MSENLREKSFFIPKNSCAPRDNSTVKKNSFNVTVNLQQSLPLLKQLLVIVNQVSKTWTHIE